MSETSLDLSDGDVAEPFCFNFGGRAPTKVCPRGLAPAPCPAVRRRACSRTLEGGRESWWMAGIVKMRGDN